MNRNLGTPIHSSNLKRNSVYLIVYRKQQILAEGLKSSMEGELVQLEKGSSYQGATKKVYSAGEELLIPNGAGQFYEAAD